MSWYFVFIFLSLCLPPAFLLNFTSQKGLKKKNLPPSPPTIPILGNLLWFGSSFSSLEPLLGRLRSKLGPIVTLYIGSTPAIFIMDRDLAHRSLVQMGEAFAHRPPPLGTNRAVSANLHTINGTTYGPLWRLLRRNFTAEVLHPSRLKSYPPTLRWSFHILVERLRVQAKEGDGVVMTLESFQHSIFSLMTLMCFGEKLDEKLRSDIRAAQIELLSLAVRLSVFNLLPRIVMVFFLTRWMKLLNVRRKLDYLLIPLIRARRQLKKQQEHVYLSSYVDSLLDLRVDVDGGRELTEDEMVSLCSEFLNSSTETTSTALHWIMANLVKHQDLQSKLWEEIKAVVGETKVIDEADIQRMPYLKAVILEGLRRHPPAHFLLPHKVSEDVMLDGYLIPKGATVNCTLSTISWDGKVWEEPMEFKPERFLAGGEGEGVDLTGSREIKMMPFGVGRRICPGLGFSMLILQYYVANLINEFKWEGVEGEVVDLTEDPGFVYAMKRPIRARISERRE